MYHETTFQELQRRRARRVAIVAAVLVACMLGWWAAVRSSAVSREQGAVALRQQVMHTALQCCAVEGSYPTSVNHLVEHYGLVLNDRDYRVSYEWLGDNVPPSVVVSIR